MVSGINVKLPLFSVPSIWKPTSESTTPGLGARGGLGGAGGRLELCSTCWMGVVSTHILILE